MVLQTTLKMFLAEQQDIKIGLVLNAEEYHNIRYIAPKHFRCHRVIRESGELGSYRSLVERKTMMLGWEASRTAC